MKPFFPIGNTVAINSTSTSASAALAKPLTGTHSVRVFNNSVYVSHVALGDSDVVAVAAASGSPANGIAIPPMDGAYLFVHGATHIASINASGQTAVVSATCGTFGE